MEDIANLIKLLSKPKDVVIIAHRNPDGDAIGSSLAMKLFLNKLHHSCHVVLPSEYPSVFEFLPHINEVVIFDTDRLKAVELIETAEIIFCLDFNSLDRIEKMEHLVNDAKAAKILIDHHLDPEPFADYYLSDTKASSTCELVFRFLEEIDHADKIDIPIGTCLFTGILTDTGSFKYATNPAVFKMASHLKSIGVDDTELNDKIFNSLTERQLNILGHALRNRMEILPELNTGIIYLSKQDYLKYQISRGDTEGLVNYILMIKGMRVAVFIREMPAGDIRLSFRSKGEISVQQLARDHFGGGGHKNASGGNSNLGLEETIDKFKSVVKNYV